MLPQDETERILGEHLAARGGAVHWQHRVTGIDQGEPVVLARRPRRGRPAARRALPGIQDAAALARLLSGVLGGEPVDLDAYEAERRPVAAGVVAMTDRLTRAATVRHPAARAVRNLVLGVAGRSPALRRKMAMNLSELSVDRPRSGAVSQTVPPAPLGSGHDQGCDRRRR